MIRVWKISYRSIYWGLWCRVTSRQFSNCRGNWNRLNSNLHSRYRIVRRYCLRILNWGSYWKYRKGSSLRFWWEIRRILSHRTLRRWWILKGELICSVRKIRCFSSKFHFWGLKMTNRMRKEQAKLKKRHRRLDSIITFNRSFRPLNFLETIFRSLLRKWNLSFWVYRNR